MNIQDCPPGKKALFRGAVLSNTSISWASNLHSTGFRSSQSRYLYKDQFPSLAQDFLVNTRNKRHNPEVDSTVSTYMDDIGITLLSLSGKESDCDGVKIELPKSTPLTMTLEEALKFRRSVRTFNGSTLSLQNVATIMRSGAGVNFEANVKVLEDCELRIPMRTVPSAGALYPVELYFVALNVFKLPRSIYRYSVDKNSLVEASDPYYVDVICQSFSTQDSLISLKEASAIILFVAKPWKTIAKYGDRGLRYVFHEAGAMAQNIHLVATALGLGSVDFSRFHEDSIDGVLNLDKKSKALIHSVILGGK